MRIGVDARALLVRRTGVERMLFHFVESLARTDLADEVFLFVDKPVESKAYSKPPYRVVVEPARFHLMQKGFDFWVSFQLRNLLRKYGLDVFYSPHTKFPFMSRVPCFTTVHGMEWCFYPAGYTLLERIKQWVWFNLCTRFSKGIITFAESTSRDIKKACRHRVAPLCVIPEAIGEQFRRLDNRELSDSVLKGYGIKKPFVLSVCSLDPRKNIDTLIRAFSEAVKEDGFLHDLVLVGQPGRGTKRLRELIQNTGSCDRTILTGYITDEDLVQLYNQADFFVYPSKYEGFGLPVLEAMACGLPVITSNISSLPEVVGHAALLIDPYSVAELKSGIVRCATDKVCKEGLSSAGLERVKEFSWDKMTDGICEFMFRESFC